jgi:hypothetical protein
MVRIAKLLLKCTTGVALVAALAALLTTSPSESRAVPAQVQTTLENAGFEGTYVAWQSSSERMIAPSWNLWYDTSVSAPKADNGSAEQRSGQYAQRLYSQSQWDNFDACVYQQIGGIPVGHQVQFSAWAKVNAHDSLSSPEKWLARIGIDPNGGTNPGDIPYYTHLSYWDLYTANKGEWQQLSVAVQATSSTVTLYACASPIWRLWFEVYWDDAQLEVNEGGLAYLPLTFGEWTCGASGVLHNSDLEEDYCDLHGYQYPIEGFGNVKLAPYWLPFWNDDYVPATGENKQPEYGPTYHSYRVHSGQVAQQCGLSGWGNYEAGIYQVIDGVRAGDTVRFSIWGMGWTQEAPSEDPYNESESDYQAPGGLRFRVGIDPYGGGSFDSSHIVWSGFYDPYDQWHRFEVTAVAKSTRVSVWAYAHPAAYWIRWNETFWDDASMTVAPAH